MHGITPIIYGDGNQTRDFIYVKDIAAANLAVLNRGSRSIYNISSNDQITINILLQKMGKLMEIEVIPNYAASRAGDIVHSRLSNTHAIRELTWQPHYTIDQGLAETCAYYKKQLS